jgi:lipoprotein-anchoring transpeptidase ErfK/SrfK
LTTLCRTPQSQACFISEALAHSWSDFSQSPSLNDQRRISTTESPIGVDVTVELSAPPPDASSQPAPVDPTTLVPSAKSFELMRQLEALLHEVAVGSRPCIKVQEGSNFAGLHTVEPSIRVSRRDQLASYRPSIDRRTFLTLVIFIATLIGVAAPFVWQSQRVSTAKSANDVAVAEKQSGVTPVGRVPLQNSPPQSAPITQTAPAPTATALEQLAAKQEQIDQNIAKPQAVKRDIKHARETVRLNGYSAGTIVIKTNERHLYYVTGEGQAIRYRVGVGKAGMAWTGQSSIDGKYISPAWQAPDSIRKDYSRLPPVIPGGSPSNPMGAAALTLSGGGQYAIHGTNNPGSIGGFVSHGCIRMYNQDIMDLYARVSVGTKVVVLR